MQPTDQELLDQLARVFAEAALERLLAEGEAMGQTQESEEAEAAVDP